MSNTRVKQHPTLRILVCTDGHILVPANYRRKPHWTLGSNSYGYLRVKINNKPYAVHKLIAETFIPNPENKPEVDHINRNPSDNRIENLRWATRSDNNRNTRSNDRCERNIGIHSYNDYAQYHRVYSAIYGHTQQGKDSKKKHSLKRSQTHKYVKFQDGTSVWVPNAEAIKYQKIPIKERKVPERILQLRTSRQSA